jgi:hypothetical protein
MVHQALKRQMIILRDEEKHQLTSGLAKYGLTRKLSSAFVILLCLGSGLDVSNLAFVCYLHHQFFNQHLFRA